MTKNNRMVFIFIIDNIFPIDFSIKKSEGRSPSDLNDIFSYPTIEIRTLKDNIIDVVRHNELVIDIKNKKTINNKNRVIKFIFLLLKIELKKNSLIESPLGIDNIIYDITVISIDSKIQNTFSPLFPPKK